MREERMRVLDLIAEGKVSADDGARLLEALESSNPVTLATFHSYVRFGQVIVADAAMENPYNDWTPRHIAQGFSWRPGSVAFRMLYDAPRIDIEVRLSSSVQVDAASERAILVPFVVSATSGVEIDREYLVHVPAGPYGLLCEVGERRREHLWCRLTFSTGASPQPQILRADAALSPIRPLLMEASPVDQ
jgi:hypothetical protein